MRKILYIDMDGVINLFQEDPNARINMWKPGYFITIKPRENIKHDLLELSKYVDNIVILTKCINRVGVKEEKEEFIHRNLFGINKISAIFVPYNDSKSDYVDKNAFTILLDDGIKNIKECEKNCNVCILFDENDKCEYQNRINKVSDVIDFL